LIAEKKDLLRSKLPISPVKKYVPAQNNRHFNPIKAQPPFPKNEMKNASGRPSSTVHYADRKPSSTTTNNVNRVTMFPVNEMNSGRESKMNVANRVTKFPTTEGSSVGKSAVNEMNSKSFFKVNETRPPVLNKSYEKTNQRVLNNPVPRNVINKSSKETKINTSVPSGHRRPSSTIHSVHRNNKNIITTEATPIVGVNAVHFVDRRPTMNGKKEVKNITNENNTKSNKETNRYFSNKLDTRKPTVFPVRNSNERKN